MADKELSVGIQVTYQNSGAAQAATDIKSVKEAAASLDEQLAAPADSLAKSQEEVSKASKTIKQSLDEVIKSDYLENNPGSQVEADAARMVRGFDQAADAAKSLFDGLQAGGGSVEGLRKIFKTIMDDTAKTEESLGGLGGAVTRLGPIIAAAMAGWSIGSFLVRTSEDLKQSLSDWGEWGDGLKRAMAKAQENELKFDGIKKGATEAIAELDRVLGRIEMVNNAEIKKVRSESEAKAAGIEQEATRQIAGASTEAEKDAIRARADIEKAYVQVNAEIIALQMQLKPYEERQAALMQQKQKATEALTAIEEETSRIISEYNTMMRIKVAAGQTEAEVAASPEGAEAGRLAGQAAKQQANAEKQIGAQLDDLNAKLTANAATIDAMNADIKAAEAKRGTEALELGGESIAALRALEEALKVAQTRTDEARGSGSNEALQSALAEQQRLQALYDDLSATIKAGAGTVGSALKEGATLVTEAATKTTEAAKEATEKTKKAGEAAAAEITGAAAGIQEATAGASGQISGAITGLGDSVASGFDRVTAGVEQVAASVAQRMATLEARLANAEATANSAANAAAVAQSQVAHMR